MIKILEKIPFGMELFYDTDKNNYIVIVNGKKTIIKGGVKDVWRKKKIFWLWISLWWL